MMNIVKMKQIMDDLTQGLALFTHILLDLKLIKNPLVYS